MRRWALLAVACTLSVFVIFSLRDRMQSSQGRIELIDERSTTVLSQAEGGSAKAFLDELPLKIISITPHTGSAAVHDDNTPVPISQRTAITVVFNRAVIALGSDFDKEGSAKDRVPFTLHCDAGVEVPGKLRWVTTYIARFDPDVDWPTDLTCEMRINLNLKTYGGIALSNPAYRTFTTPALAMSLSSVSSEKAKNATGGWWDAFLAGPDPDNRVPEVPEDGRVSVSFTHPVDLELLRTALVLEGPGGERVPIRVEKADEGAAGVPMPAFRGGFYGGYNPTPPAMGYATVIPAAPLALDAVYTLRLPAGSRVHPLAGPTKEALEARLGGPTSFTFPFLAVPGTDSAQYVRPQYRRYHLWLKHGLLAAPGTAAETAALDALAAAIRVSPAVPIKVKRINLARVQVEGAFEPDVDYEIRVSPSDAVRDAFGNPLVASETAFRSAEGPSFFVQPQGYTLFDADFGGRWHVLAAGEKLRVGEQYGGHQLPLTPYAVAGAAVGPVGADFEALVLALRDKHTERDPVLAETSRIEAPLTPAIALARARDVDGAFEGLDAAALLKPSGLFARHSYVGVGWDCSGGPCGPYVQRQTEFTAVSDVAVSLVASAGELVAWVTRLADARSVAGAQVLVYGFSWNDREVRELGRQTTGADGTATFPAFSTEGGMELSAFVVHEGRVLYHPQVPIVYAGIDESVRGTILTDRAMYKEGDVVHVKGYLRANDGASGLRVPDESGALHWLEVRWSDQRPAAEHVQVTVDPEYGSFDAELKVPSDVSYGQRGIALMSSPISKGAEDVEKMATSPRKIRSPERVKGYATPPRPMPGVDSFKVDFVPGGDPAAMVSVRQLAWASVTIADPRVPTVTLALETGAKLVPPGASATIPVTVTCKTYVGTAVSGASVTIKWRVAGGGMHVMPRAAYGKGGMPDAPGASASPLVGVNLPSDWLGPPEVLPPPQTERPESSGELVATTGADGTAKVDVALAAPSLKRALEAGDHVDLTAVWVGPTREELKETASVRVAPAEVEVLVTPAYSPVLPGREVRWLVSVLSVLDGSSVPGAVVSMKLYPWNAGPKVSIPPPDATGRLVIPGVTDQKPAAECKAAADGGRAFQCPLTLPSVGRFLLVAEATDGKGKAAVTAVPLGSTAEEWRKRPLRSLGSLASVLDKDEYERGDTAKLRLASAHFPAGTRALVRWGAKSPRQQAFVDLPAAAGGLVEVPVPIGPECAGPCPLTVAIITPRAALSPALPADLAVSPLLDPAAPRLQLVQTTLRVKEAARAMKLAVAPAAEKVLPGARTSLKITLKDADGRPAAGEVSVWAVDQALLDLMPHPLARLNESFAAASAPGDQVADSRQLLATAKSYGLTIDVARRRLALDPWLAPSGWPLRAEGGGPYYWGPVGDVDIPDEEVLASAKSEITRFPWGPGPVFAMRTMHMAKGAMMESAVAVDAATPRMMAAPAPAAAYAMPQVANALAGGAPPGAGGAGGGASGLAVSVPVRSAFQAVPLSKRALAVPASGELVVDVVMPDNAGTFAIRAYAAAGRSAPDAFGQAESSIVARRPLSLQPSVPRIVRLGDAFECGATLTATDPAFVGSADVGASLAAGSPLALAGEDRKSAPLTGAAPKEVRFAFTASALGEAAITFAARGSGGDEDALEAKIPVEPLSEAVFVASSVAVQATAAGAAWDEGVELPPAVPGTGSVSLDASVGREAAVEAMSRLVLAARDSDVNGETSLATIGARGAMAAYASPDSSVQPPETALAVERAYDPAVAALESHSDPGRGLRRYARDTNSNWVDANLNAYALFVDDRLAVYGLRLPNNLREWYTEALGREMERQAQDARNYGHTFGNWDGLALARLALSPAWQTSYDELSWDSLLAHIDSCSMHGKAATALAAILHSDAGRAKNAPASPPSDKRIAAVLDFLLANVRVQGRVAYIANDAGSARPAGLQANAMALMALVRGGHAANPLVEKLANSVARGSPPGPTCYGPSPLQVAVASLAVADYDAVRSSTAADLTLAVTSGDHGLLSGEFKGPRPAPKHAEASWDALDNPPKPLVFAAKGVGEVSVAAGLRFVPAKLYAYPLYRGLYVERSIRRVDGASLQARGVPVGAASLAETLLVTVQITTPDEVWGVQVVDLLPGGLEAVDPNVDPAGRTDAIWGSPFYHREVKKDRVVLHARVLAPGTHAASYQVRAVTAGTFALPSTRAFAVEQPELMGLAPAGSFAVRDGPVSDAEAARAATYAASDPKPCPSCGEHGSCNLRTGVCECEAGYSGASCQTSPEAAAKRLRG